MKVLLTLVICSAVAGDCLPAFQYPTSFDNYYDCMIKGYEESKLKSIQIGPEEINLHQIYIKFGCSEVPHTET